VGKKVDNAKKIGRTRNKKVLFSPRKIFYKKEKTLPKQSLFIYSL